MRITRAVSYRLLTSDGGETAWGIDVGEVTLDSDGHHTLRNPVVEATIPPLIVKGGIISMWTDPRVEEYARDWSRKLGLPYYWDMHRKKDGEDNG